MEISRGALPPGRALNPRAPLNRRFGFVAFAALAVLLCSGASSSPTACQSGSNDSSFGAEIVGAAVGVGVALAVIVVVLVDVTHGRHVIKGCVSSGPNGLELQTSDSKRFMLEGDSASVKVGDRVKLHGSRVKKAKGAAGDQVFTVEKLNRDYGPCPAAPPPSPST